MKTTEISNSQNIIDSRDVIARIESLESELTDAHEAEGNGGEFDDWLKNASEDCEHTLLESVEELLTLRALAEEGSGSPDWPHGEALIRDSYFTEYAEQVADDIGAIDRNSTWPLCHIDWNAAADSLKQDYMNVEFGDVTYWIRA